jgi:hypothetical protein
MRITPFQFHLVEWIELQNRAVDFLDRYGRPADGKPRDSLPESHGPGNDGQADDAPAISVTLDSPRELNDAAVMSRTFRRLELPCRGPEIVIAGNRNRTPLLRTRVTAGHLEQAAAVLGALPEKHFAIFRRPLFARFAWTPSLLNRYASPDSAPDANRAPQSVA